MSMLAFDSVGKKPADNRSTVKSWIAGNAIGRFLNSENPNEATRGALFFSQEVAKNKKVHSLKQVSETGSR